MKGNELKQKIKSYIDNSTIEGNSKDSLENKTGAFRRFLNYLGDKEFSSEQIRSYTIFLMEKGLQPSSIATDLRKFMAFVNWLFEQEIIDKNWSKQITLPKIPYKEIDVPSAEIAEKIIIAGTTTDKHNVHKVVNNEGRDAILLMLRTGLRVNEVLLLEKNDLLLKDRGHEKIRVKSKGKSGEKDTLPLMGSAIEILKRPRIIRDGCHKNHFFWSLRTCNECHAS